MGRSAGVLVAVAVVLCSCATTSTGVNETLAQCDGQPLQKAVQLLGPPYQIEYDAAGGDRVLRWAWIHMSRVVLVRMEVGADDRVVSTQWQYRDEGEPTLPRNQPGLGIP